MSFIARQTAFAREENRTNSAKLIAIYARVSTARQEEEGTIETQLAALRDFARQNGCTILKEYMDDGWSGDILARPALDALRQEVRSRTWQAVLIYDPDRLARRYSYQELVTDELREAGVEVIFVTVPAPRNSEEKILHGVRGLFAEYERAKIAERFRLGKLRKVRDGHVLVSEAPYGYTYVPKHANQPGRYQINEDEARIVKMIFGWVADEGLTLRQVIRRLHECGIRPRESRRGVWYTSTLSSLLRNTAYVGEAVWNASYAVVPERPLKKDTYRRIKKSSRRARPKEEWITVPVPAIIDKELFERARSRLDLNYAMSRRNRKNEYLLAGKIRCVCGRSRAGEGPQHGKYLYYRCSDRVLSFPLPPTCKERGVNAAVADRLVWQRLFELMSSPQLMTKQIERWQGAHRAKGASAENDLTETREEIAKLKVQETRYNKAYGAGLFTLEQLQEYVEPIKVRILALERQLSNAMHETHQSTIVATPNRDTTIRFAAQSRQTLSDLHFAQKRSIVLNIIEKVVATQQQLHVYGFIPLSNYVEFCPEDRHGQDTMNKNAMPRIPFEFTIALPPPLKRGVDYGFLPDSNISKAA
jgi:site-specific DNA recombinase